MQTVRLWDRHNGSCKAVLALPYTPSAVNLLSDDLTLVTCHNKCLLWQGSTCLQRIVSLNELRICAIAICDNLLFMVSEREKIYFSPCCFFVCFLCFIYVVHDGSNVAEYGPQHVHDLIIAEPC